MSALPNPIDVVEWDGGLTRIPAGADEPTRFTVTDDAQATWAMRKLAALRKREEEINSIAEQEVERVEAWRHSQVDALAGDINYFTGLLTTYARQEREINGRKSITLPHGAIKSRAGNERVDIVNADEFIKWAQGNSPTLLRVKVEPDKNAIKACLTDAGDAGVIDSNTGEIVPGVAITRSETTYTVEVSQ